MGRSRGRLAAAGFGCLAIGILSWGCQSTPAPSATVVKPGELGPAALAGKQLFLTKGCVACHRAPNIPEAQGTIGPNLRGVGNPAAHPKIAAVVDNTPENMQRWLLDPSKLKPGTAMPNLGLTDEEARNLVALMETFQ
jgi:cytochrome c2